MKVALKKQRESSERASHSSAASVAAVCRRQLSRGQLLGGSRYPTVVIDAERLTQMTETPLKQERMKTPRRRRTRTAQAFCGAIKVVDANGN